MMPMVTRKVFLRPQRSPSRPNTSAPTGMLTRKIQRHEVQVTKARKTLFGLDLPDLGLFGRTRSKTADEAAKTSGEEEGVEFLEAKIASARLGPDRKWSFVLEDGARWAQTELKDIPTPKTGQPILIRKAALGSYLARINDRPAIRVKRLN